MKGHHETVSARLDEEVRGARSREGLAVGFESLDLTAGDRDQRQLVWIGTSGAEGLFRPRGAAGSQRGEYEHKSLYLIRLLKGSADK